MGTRVSLSRSSVGKRGSTGSLGSVDWAAEVVEPAGGLGAADFQPVGRGEGGCTGIEVEKWSKVVVAIVGEEEKKEGWKRKRRESMAVCGHCQLWTG
jgi:hypothetical protein